MAVTFAAGYWPGMGPRVAEKRDYGHGLARAHVALGRDLADLTPIAESDSTSTPPLVAALDCGAIAYYSGWETLDTFGLNEPVIATTGDRDPTYILDHRPDVLVLIARRADTFEAAFDYEEPLRVAALERGYRHAATYTFLPNYHLFVFTSSETLSSALGSRDSG